MSYEPKTHWNNVAWRSGVADRTACGQLAPPASMARNHYKVTCLSCRKLLPLRFRSRRRAGRDPLLW